jgi:hypothetical protein
MALPSFLFSSFQQYKEDTNVFITWIHEASKTCGRRAHTASAVKNVSTEVAPSPVIAAPSRRLKGKARKEAKSASAPVTPTPPEPKYVRHKVSTAEILEQAHAIAQPAIQRQALPVSVRRIVERAITTRRRCAAWYRSQVDADKASNDGHRHFINVLQNALSILDEGASARRKPAPAAQDGVSESLRYAVHVWTSRLHQHCGRR